MKLYLIRHGQSSNNLLWAETQNWVGRSPDPLLTELGELQAVQLATHFASGSLPQPTVLFSSLMIRAIQTAAPLATALDLPIQGHLELNEVRGPFTGAKTEALTHPGSPASKLLAVTERLVLPEKATEDGWYDRGFETPAGAVARAEQAIRGILDSYVETDETVAIVCHEWFAQYLLRSAMGMQTSQDQEIPWFTFNNTCHAMVDYASTKSGDPLPPEIRWTNRSDHLREDQRTS